MSEEKTRIVRAEGIRLKLDADLLRRAEVLAKQMGMPTATMAAFALGQYVNQMEQAMGNQRLMFEQIGRGIGDQVGRDLRPVIDKFLDAFSESQNEGAQLPEAH